MYAQSVVLPFDRSLYVSAAEACEVLARRLLLAGYNCWTGDVFLAGRLAVEELRSGRDCRD